MEVFDDGSLVFNVLLRKGSFHEMFLPLTRGNDMLSEFFSEGLYGKNQIEFLAMHTSEEIVEMVLHMYHEQLNRDTYTDQLLIGIMTVLSALIMRRFSETIISSHTFGHAGESENFMVLNYMQEHLETVTLQEISEHFGFSVSHCSRLIKSSTGLGFNSWKRSLRMRRAENMLLNTKKSVSEISSLLGYINTETFIRTFKKELHMTPSQYRSAASAG